MPAEILPSAPPPFAAAPRRPTRTLHLAAAIDGREVYGARHYVELARLAEGGALDFVTLGGGGGADGAGDGGGAGGAGGEGGGGVDGGGAWLDALAVLARVAPATDRIGVVPTVPASSAEAFDLALAVATLDWVSRGRAGWTVMVPEGGGDTGGGPDGGTGPGGGRRSRGGGAVARTGSAGAVRGVGGRGAAARRRVAVERAEARWRAAEQAVAAVARVWDGDAAAPRAPQGRPVTAVDATEPAARGAAARHADLAFVRAARPEPAARIRAELRRLAAEAGRDPDRLLVLAELSIDLGGGELGPEPGAETALAPDGAGGVLFSGGPVDLAGLMADWHRSGAVDGFHVRPVEPRRDLERFVNGTAALLQHRGLFRAFHPGTTLREHLGLHRSVSHGPENHRPENHRPADRVAVTGGAAT